MSRNFCKFYKKHVLSIGFEITGFGSTKCFQNPVDCLVMNLFLYFIHFSSNQKNSKKLRGSELL